MAITNPNKLVNVQELAYFKSKADTVYVKVSDVMTVAQAESLFDSIFDTSESEQQ